MPALAVSGLDKSFGGLRVTSAVSLAVEPGERRLIIGPNGAGKTTLFNLITGELKPDRGAVTLIEVDLPAPLRPSRPSSRPSPRRNETRCSTWLSP